MAWSRERIAEELVRKDRERNIRERIFVKKLGTGNDTGNILPIFKVIVKFVRKSDGSASTP